MKYLNSFNFFYLQKGVAAFLLAGSILTSCIDDIDMQPSTDSVNGKSEQFLANSKSSEASAVAATNFVAPLSGKEEVPSVETKATGNAILKLVGDEIHYKLIVANIEDITMAHLHTAPVGFSGMPVVWLLPSSPPPTLLPGRSNGIVAEGIITAEDLTGPLTGSSIEDLLDALREGLIYVNVHTVSLPGGEIRGQVKPAGKK